MSGTHMEPGDGSLIVSAKDDVKMRFYRAALLATYPGQTRSGMKLALWMIECMNWETGVVVRNTSIHRLMAMTKLSRSRVDDGLKELSEAGLINRTYVGGGRRGSIKVADAIVELQVGQNVSELWPEDKPALKWGKNVKVATCPDLGQPTCPDLGQDRPHFGASYPIPSSPEENPCKQQHGIDGGKRPTTEGALPTTPKLPAPSKEEKERPPLPPVVSATSKSRVALATVKTQVADAPSPYGYGTEIAGFDGDTSVWVDRLVKAAGGIVLDKTPYWTVLKETARQTSPRRAQAAILDIEAKKGAGKLEGRPEHVLKAFARTLTEDVAATKLDGAKPQPFNLMRHMTDYGRRR